MSNSPASQLMYSSDSDIPQDEDCVNPVEVWEGGSEGKWVPHPYVSQKAPMGPCSEEEGDFDEEIIAHDKGEKNNFRKRIACDEEYEEFDLSLIPDLGTYFAPFGMSKPSEIAMCRTYANHLAQQVKAEAALKRMKLTKMQTPRKGKKE